MIVAETANIYTAKMETVYAPLSDRFGRDVTYLRLSVTDRCDLRCTYCMAERMTFLPREDLLTLEELERLAEAFIARGVRKIRITGGEPLVRRDVMTLFDGLGARLGDGLEELTLTSNATRLNEFAAPLAAAGVRRVNVSLDSIVPETFRRITRRGDLDKVLAGIAAASRAGLRVKLNTVALKDENIDEIPDLVAWAHGEGHEVTLIEVMPLGETGEDRVDQYVPLPMVRDRNFAGTTSSRSERSSPMQTISPHPQGQSVFSGSTTSSMRSRWAGKWPRLR